MKSKSPDSIPSPNRDKRYKSFSPAFGIELKALRKGRGLTLHGLAQAAQISHVYVANVEYGVFPPPSSEIVTRLARALAVPAEDLLAKAGRIPSDLPGIILTQPTEYARFLRMSRGIPQALLQDLTEQVRTYKERNRRKADPRGNRQRPVRGIQRKKAIHGSQRTEGKG